MAVFHLGSVEVSGSFGFGGSNAHVILESYARTEASPAQTASRQKLFQEAHLLKVSAWSEEALRTACGQISQNILTSQDKIEDVLYSINERSTSYHYRAVVVAGTLQDTAEALRCFANSMKPPSSTCLETGIALPGSPPKLVFVFSGMGTQMPEMLYKLAADASMTPLISDISSGLCKLGAKYQLSRLLEEGDTESICNNTEIAQVAIFTLQLCLSQWFRQLGIRPHVCVGHSVGEVAAFYVAGRLSFEDAVRIIFFRASVLKEHAQSGEMMALMMDAQSAEQAIRESKTALEIAALNSEKSVVVSGRSEEIRKLESYLSEQGTRTRILDNVSVGFHSKCVDPVPLLLNVI